MKIGILGDFIQSPANSFDPEFLKIIQSTDFNIVNLEAPFVKETYQPANGKFGLHQLQTSCEQLHQLNIKVVSLANNHSFDFGADGFRHTRETLQNEKIAFFGSGRNSEEATALWEYSKGSISIAIGGYVSPYLTRYIAKPNRAGVAGLKKELILSQLKKSKAKIKILFNHWNQEFERYPEPYFLNLGKALLQHCDYIVGSHSHCVQGISSYENKKVFHSLGNLCIPHTQYRNIFLQKYQAYCYDAYALILSIDNAGILGYEIVPYKISETGTKITLLSRVERQAFDKRLNKYSEDIASKERGYRYFYQANKSRPLRPTLSNHHFLNICRLSIYFSFLKLIRCSIRGLVKILDYLGIRSFLRKKFSNSISKLFKL